MSRTNLMISSVSHISDTVSQSGVFGNTIFFPQYSLLKYPTTRWLGEFISSSDNSSLETETSSQPLSPASLNWCSHLYAAQAIRLYSHLFCSTNFSFPPDLYGFLFGRFSVWWRSLVDHFTVLVGIFSLKSSILVVEDPQTVPWNAVHPTLRF